MSTILKPDRDTTKSDADANYYPESDLLRSDLKVIQSDDLVTSADAQHLATIILALDGLTGAEVETAERVLSGDFNPNRDTRRLRTIAINHSILERWMIR
jgi:hypothetical protein